MRDKSKKNKTFKTKTAMVLYFLEGSKFLFALSILFSIMVTFFDMIGPKIIQYTVDYYISDTASNNSGSVPVYIGMIMGALGERDNIKGT